MKRISVGLALVLGLLLAMGGSALATPMVPGDAGVFLFVERLSDGDFWNSYGNMIGVGYSAKNWSVGYARATEDFGQNYIIYANTLRGPVLLKGEYYNDIGYGRYYKLHGLYLFDLDAFQLGAGLSYFYETNGGRKVLAVEAGGDIEIAGGMSAFGSLTYAISGDEPHEPYFYKLGLRYNF